MGAAGSTISKDDVKDIIEDEVDLSSYVKSSDLDVYAKSAVLPALYVDENDKATLDTSNDNDSRWVTPKYVQTKFATGNVDASEVARNLATISDFQPVITNALRDNTTFQSGVARNLATVGTFQTAIWNNISGEVGSTFRSDLIARMAGDSRFKGPRGDNGPAGTFNNAAIQANLWNGTGEGEGKKVMWCADGELCQVPVGKKGIQFTGVDQVISGYSASTTEPKVVKVDDHLYLKPGGEINFVRDGSKETSTNSNITGSYGRDDGRIKVRENTGTTDSDYRSAELEIIGIGKKLSDGKRVPRKIKMYDNVEIISDLKVGKGIDKSLTIRAPEDAYKSGEASLEFKNSYTGDNTTYPYTLGRIQGVDIGTSTFSGRLKFDIGYNTGYRNLMSMDHTGIDMHPTGYGYTALRLKNDTDKDVVFFYNSSSRSDDGGQRTATLRNNGGKLRLTSNGKASIEIDGDDNITMTNGKASISLEGDKINLNGNVNIRYPGEVAAKFWKTTNAGSVDGVNGNQYFEFYNNQGGRSRQWGWDGNGNNFTRIG
jgi:hypothetical protein